MKKMLSPLSLTLLMGMALPSRADVITPGGLSPGDQFRIVFVSSGARDAESSDIADYDLFITDLAVAAGIDAYFGAPVTWQVLGSTDAISAISRLPVTSAPVYRIDGVKVADSGSDLWDGTVDAAIDVTELGGAGIDERVATGTLASGFQAGGSAFGDSSGAVETGLSSATGSGWVDEGVGGSGGLWRLYGFSSVLTVVPEPASVALVLVGITGLAGDGWRRRKRAA